VHGSTMLAVTRGLGAVGLPWRIGANPEAVLLRIRAVPSS
jgi:predicted MPP superfamily phosphohydrolase